MTSSLTLNTNQTDVIRSATNTAAVVNEDELFGATAPAVVQQQQQQQEETPAMPTTTEVQYDPTYAAAVIAKSTPKRNVPPQPTQQAVAAPKQPQVRPATPTVAKEQQQQQQSAAPTTSFLTISKMEPSDAQYPRPVSHWWGSSALPFWYVGDPRLLSFTGVGLVQGEREGLEKEGDHGYRIAQQVINKLAPKRVLVLGNKITPVTEQDGVDAQGRRKFRDVRSGADAYLAQFILNVSDYKGIILVLGTALTKQIIEHYREPIESGKMIILTFIDPALEDQRGNIKFFGRKRSEFVAAYCQDVVVLEVSDPTTGSWMTVLNTRAFGHRLHAIESANLYAQALNKDVITIHKATPLRTNADLKAVIR